jgi:hypothetical protein
MRTTLLLLAFSLLLPTLTGCPPIRRGNGGSGDDDDATTDDDDATDEGYALDDGTWVSGVVDVLEDPCGVAPPDVALGFDLATIDGWSFRTDWGVDTDLTCSISGAGFFECASTEFFVDEDPVATLSGSLAFEGEILSESSLDGLVSWVLTCNGDCEGYNLPSGVSCAVAMESNFFSQPEGVPDPEEPPAQP